MEKGSIIDINGFKLDTKDCIYEVVPKYDADAPDGFKAHRTTKLLSKSAGRSILTVPFIEEVGLWDTGLYEDSPMYAGLSKEDKENKLRSIKELIVEPYVNIYGEERLDPTNIDSEFWNLSSKSSFKIDLWRGRIFNTRKPEELLQLFIAISLGKLAPKEYENEYLYNQAQFCVENKDEVKTLKQEKDLQEIEAYFKFKTLLEEGSDKLPLVMNYLGIKTPSNRDKGLTTQIFKAYADRKGFEYDNRSLFLETVDKINTKEGYEELQIYKMLQDLYKRGAVTRSGEYYYLEGEEMATGSLKNCAEKVQKDKGLLGRLMELQE